MPCIQRDRSAPRLILPQNLATEHSGAANDAPPMLTDPIEASWGPTNVKPLSSKFGQAFFNVRSLSHPPPPFFGLWSSTISPFGPDALLPFQQWAASLLVPLELVGVKSIADFEVLGMYFGSYYCACNLWCNSLIDCSYLEIMRLLFYHRGTFQTIPFMLFLVSCGLS